MEMVEAVVQLQRWIDVMKSKQEECDQNRVRSELAALLKTAITQGSHVEVGDRGDKDRFRELMRDSALRKLFVAALTDTAQPDDIVIVNNQVFSIWKYSLGMAQEEVIPDECVDALRLIDLVTSHQSAAGHNTTRIISTAGDDTIRARRTGNIVTIFIKSENGPVKLHFNTEDPQKATLTSSIGQNPVSNATATPKSVLTVPSGPQEVPSTQNVTSQLVVTKTQKPTKKPALAAISSGSLVTRNKNPTVSHTSALSLAGKSSRSNTPNTPELKLSAKALRSISPMERGQIPTLKQTKGQVPASSVPPIPNQRQSNFSQVQPFSPPISTLYGQGSLVTRPSTIYGVPDSRNAGGPSTSLSDPSNG